MGLNESSQGAKNKDGSFRMCVWNSDADAAATSRQNYIRYRCDVDQYSMYIWYFLPYEMNNICGTCYKNFHRKVPHEIFHMVPLPQTFFVKVKYI